MAEYRRNALHTEGAAVVIGGLEVARIAPGDVIDFGPDGRLVFLTAAAAGTDRQRRAEMQKIVRDAADFAFERGYGQATKEAFGG